ncbi:hypothetical protein J1N35_015141, partial [Gossypium stocksii]
RTLPEATGEEEEKKKKKKKKNARIKIPTAISACYCGNLANLRTSWSNSNQCRRLLGCKKYGSSVQNACHFFAWLDPPLMPYSRIMLLDVLKKVRIIEDAKRERKHMVDEGQTVSKFAHNTIDLS